MVVLDDVPFLFTDLNVWRYQKDTDIWEDEGLLSYSRSEHTVVAVPEDWLCLGHFTTSSTTTMSSTETTTSTTTTSTTTSITTTSTTTTTTTSITTTITTDPNCPTNGNFFG